MIRYRVESASTGTHDAVIVGAGHNGLVTAAFLAKSGHRVPVLEARAVVGGLCWSKELDKAPGFQVSPCSLEFLLTGVDYDENIPLTTIVPSVADRSLVPPGSAGDTLYLYAFNTPIQLSHGRDWASESDTYMKTAMAVFDSYAPGTSDMVLDQYNTAPPEFESRYNVYKGNYSHADLTLAQMGPWRPTPSLAAYRTPVESLWHTGSGAFPMSYLSGWPGRNTAREVAKALNPRPRRAFR